MSTRFRNDATPTKRGANGTSDPTIDDDLIDELANEAEAGDDVDSVIARRGKRGRPRLGSAPSTVVSVRLDPDLKQWLARRAEDDGVWVSEAIREALRHHLEPT